MYHLTSIVSLLLALTLTNQAPAPRSSMTPPDGDVQIRINGPVHIGVSDTASAVWVINHDATVDGVVREGLVVINGTAKITGRVEGGVVVANGRLELAPGARIERDVMLYRSVLTRANDAVIAGEVHNQTGFSVGAGVVWLMWLSFTIVVVFAGLLFAELGPRALTGSADYLTAHGGRSALTALMLVGTIPALAFTSFATVIGIPLGLTLLFVVIPALSFVGYLVAGSVLGKTLVTRLSATGAWTNRYRTIVVGLVTLQVIVALPVIGGLIALLASLFGVGALVAYTWSRRERAAPAVVPLAAGA
jgi:hypothetical protein